MTEPKSSNLEQAIERFEIPIDPEKADRMKAYCEVLWRMNESLNLTRHTDFDTFVSRDVLDSWKLSQHLISGERVLDVGSGGGVPGILLAILRPDVHVALCECVKKKARSLAQIVSELGLGIPVFADRSEDVVAAAEFDTLVARAVGPLPKLLTWMQDSWDRFDRMLLTKGPKWVEERGEARHRGLMKNLELRKIDAYPMPGTYSESVILMVWPKGRDISRFRSPDTNSEGATT